MARFFSSLSRRRLPLVIWITRRAPSTPTSSQELERWLGRSGWTRSDPAGTASAAADRRSRAAAPRPRRATSAGGGAGARRGGGRAVGHLRTGGGGGVAAPRPTTRTVSLLSSSSVSQWARTVPPPTPMPSHLEGGGSVLARLAGAALAAAGRLAGGGRTRRVRQWIVVAGAGARPVRRSRTAGPRMVRRRRPGCSRQARATARRRTAARADRSGEGWRRLASMAARGRRSRCRLRCGWRQRVALGPAAGAAADSPPHRRARGRGRGVGLGLGTGGAVAGRREGRAGPARSGAVAARRGAATGRSTASDASPAAQHHQLDLHQQLGRVTQLRQRIAEAADKLTQPIRRPRRSRTLPARPARRPAARRGAG